MMQKLKNTAKAKIGGLFNKIRPKASNSLNSSLNEHIQENIQSFLSTRKAKTVPKTHPKNFQNQIEILIPCYNHATYLQAAFDSITNQTKKYNLTVTFINDNSSDNSLNEMKRIRAENKNKTIQVKIINNSTNLLQWGALNKAIKLSKNKLFVVLNADDMLTPDCLKVIVDTYTKHQDIFMLGGSSLWFEDQANLPEYKQKGVSSLGLKKYGPKDAQTFNTLNSINMSQSSCSFFKTAWDIAGGYYPIEKRVCSYDDRDFQMRVCALMPIGVYEDYPMEYYRTDSSQQRATI